MQKGSPGSAQGKKVGLLSLRQLYRPMSVAVQEGVVVERKLVPHKADMAEETLAVPEPAGQVSFERS